MISTSALCAQLEGTFEARYNIAKNNFNRDPSEENRIKFYEAQRAYDTVYGILYEFGESNATDYDNTSC
jgi:hypothetical protein